MQPTNVKSGGTVGAAEIDQAVAQITPTVDRAPTVEALDDAVDHLRGSQSGRLIVEYGDYECTASHAAYRNIKKIERRLRGEVRFAFRHYPLTTIHPHALGASAAAEAAAIQGGFWDMHELLFHARGALEDDDLLRYADELALDVDRFERDRRSDGVLARVHRDVEGAVASGDVLGSPTVFIDGVVHLGPHDVASLLRSISRQSVS
jgi:protein-disulfide isomerase